MVVFKNPKGVKSSSLETIKSHTHICENCGVVVINLNAAAGRLGKYCSRECASQYRKNSGWSPSEEAIRKASEANRGRVVSEETREKLRTVSIDKDSLTRAYLEEGKTQKECAILFECSKTTISRYLKEYDLVGKKGNREAQVIGTDNDGRYTDKGWFYQKYIVERKGTSEIAEMCNAGRTTIKRWLKKHGLEARSGSEALKGLKRSLESCAKQSKTMSRNFVGIGWGPSKFYEFMGGVYCGTWEFETARYFYSLGIKYKSHGEFETLPYMDNEGRSRNYVPDFYLPKQDKYIEVKGRFSDEVKEKMRLVLEQNNIELEIWRQKDLEERGILSSNHSKKVAEGYYDKYLIKKQQK